MAAILKQSFDFLGSESPQIFVYSAGGGADKSKTPYLTILPDLFEVMSRMTSSMNSICKVVAFAYSGWSSKMVYSITGMTFHYIDRDWKMKSFPI